MTGHTMDLVLCECTWICFVVVLGWGKFTKTRHRHRVGNQLFLFFLHSGEGRHHVLCTCEPVTVTYANTVG